MLPAGIIVLGLVQGSLAALNSLGFVLLWRTTRLVNLAQPSLGLIGGVLTGLLVVTAGWSFWLAAPLGMAMGGAVAFGADRLVLRRLQEAPRAVLLVATVGLAGIFGGIATALPFAFTGRTLPTYTIDLGVTVDVFPVRLLGPHLLALAALPLALLGMLYFLHRTRLGLAALALGQDAERARTLGVPAQFVRSVVWVVAGMLASVSGILAIPALGFNLGGGLGPTVLLLALAPAVFAGFRSLTGAVVAALVLGVAYQALIWYSKLAGTAELMLAGAMVLAGAVLAVLDFLRPRVAREEAAARASSWEAAATPRPLAWAVASARAVRVGGVLFAIVAGVAAALPPLFLGPGSDSLYTASATLAIGALAVAVAWMFAGEVVLGHWGFAGLGAAMASFMPGPWAMRCLAAALVIGAACGILGLASRRPSSLSFAVIGLAVAAAAPVVLLNAKLHTQSVDPGRVGMIAGPLAVLAAISISKLRASGVGARMVAARDDPQRAPWLGADPLSARVIGLSLSGALAGLAGAIYLSATPPEIAAGGFDASRSLDVLSMAVVGGLGSPFGALLGAATLQGARYLLAGPWAALASGAGVLLVVIFKPAGISRLILLVRDGAIRVLLREPRRGHDAGRPPVRVEPVAAP